MISGLILNNKQSSRAVKTAKLTTFINLLYIINMRYVVTYTANSCDEHDCDSIYHTHKFSRTFKDKIDALHFLGECTSNHKDLHAIEEPVETEETEPLKTFVDHEGTIIYYY